MLSRTGKLIVAGGVIGLLLVIFGIVIEHVPGMIMKKSVPLVDEPSSKTFPGWSNPSLPIYMKFHFFNVTNVKEVMAGEKPIVKELGPYVYREQREKVNIEFNEYQTEVSYNEKIWFHFEPEMSAGSLEDVLAVYNVPYVTLINALMVASVTNPKAELATFFINGQANIFRVKLFEYHTVQELLWGYEAKILKLLRRKTKFKARIHTAQFGFFKDRNGTEGANMTVGTGLNSLLDIAQVKSYNNNDTLDYWYSDCANAINGTDGAMFHPGVARDEKLFMFSPELCRSLWAEFVKEEKIHGVTTYRFSPSPLVFAGPEEYPSNKDFCYPDGKKESCLGRGLMMVSKCRKNAPLVASPPHFLGVEPKVANEVIGMSPDPELHTTQLNVEPNSGFLLYAKKRIQYNAIVMKEDGQAIYRQVPKGRIIPLFWVEEGLEAPPAFAARLERIPKLINMCHNLMLAFVAIGALLLLGCLLAAFVYSERVFDRQATLHTAEMKAVPTTPPQDDSYDNGKYKASQLA